MLTFNFERFPWIKKLRWLWFVFAIVLIVQTPSVVMAFVPYMKANLWLMLPGAFGLFMRGFWIFLFFMAWWKARPGGSNEMGIDKSTLQPPDQKTLNAHRRFQFVLWLTMVLWSIMVFFVVTPLLARTPGVSHGVETTFLLIGIGLVAFSFPLKSKLRGQFSEARDPLRERRALMLALAVCESAAVLGVALHSISESHVGQLLMLIGTAGLLMHYPRRREREVES